MKRYEIETENYGKFSILINKGIDIDDYAVFVDIYQYDLKKNLCKEYKKTYNKDFSEDDNCLDKVREDFIKNDIFRKVHEEECTVTDIRDMFSI